MQNSNKIKGRKGKRYAKWIKMQKKILQNRKMYDTMMLKWEEGRFMKRKAIYRGGKSLIFIKYKVIWGNRYRVRR